MRSLLQFFRLVFSLKNIIHPDNLLAIGFAALLIMAISNINLEILNPIGEAFGDVDVTDIAYSHLDKNEEYRGVGEDGLAIIDTNIVIVNVGYLNRKQIAQQIFKINQNGAKVIGMDVHFPGEKDPLGDMVLSSAIGFGKNVVLMSKAVNYDPDSGECDSIFYSYDKFSDKAAALSIANMVTDNEGTSDSRFSICRAFVTKTKSKLNGETVNAFPIEVARLFDSTQTSKILERNKQEEYVNFVGDIYKKFKPKSMFKAYDINYNDSAWCEPNAFKGKIVLMGFLGANLDEETGEDKFFTPMNHKYVGKSNRDMYGVVVHANSIAMILRGNFIDEIPTWLSHIIGFLITYLTFAMFRGIFNDYKVWYDGLTKLLSILLIMVILYFELMIFYMFDYKIAFSGIYFGILAFSGDFLEIYYGLIKNIYYKVSGKRRKIN